MEMAKITSTVADLTLDFTLPGYDIDLKEGGQDAVVDLSNLEEYIRLVIDWTLRKGVMLQLKEFKSGFSSVFPVRDLQSFTPAELVMLTGALDEDWSIEGASTFFYMRSIADSSLEQASRTRSRRITASRWTVGPSAIYSPSCRSSLSMSVASSSPSPQDRELSIART